MQPDIRALLTGGIAGGLATVPMTAFMLAAQRMGYLGEAPPRLITRFTFISAKLPLPDENAETVATGSVHFGFGIVSGALFSVLTRRAQLPFPNALQGMLFGMSVWFVSYKGWVPALNIMPPPGRGPPRPAGSHDPGAPHLWLHPGLGHRARRKKGFPLIAAGATCKKRLPKPAGCPPAGERKWEGRGGEKVERRKGEVVRV